MVERRLLKLEELLSSLYKKHRRSLLFHGWHHILFVKNKSAVFARELKADVFIVQSAALVHDLNYIVRPDSHPKDGKILREKLLKKCLYTLDEIEKIESIIIEENTGSRHKDISIEAKALSDADTLFKSLPITPILFASKYIEENKVNIQSLARKICDEQIPLLKQDIYFYTKLAKGEYLGWAKTNLELWKNTQDCLKDKDVQRILKIAKSNGVFN